MPEGEDGRLTLRSGCLNGFVFFRVAKYVHLDDCCHGSRIAAASSGSVERTWMPSEDARPMWIEAMSEIAARYGLTVDAAHRPRPTRFILRGCSGLARRGDFAESFPIDVRDVSITGIGFLTKGEVSPGERLGLTFTGDPFERLWHVEVVWTDSAGEQGTRVGSRVVRAV